jgi:hypothetical protein
MPLGSTTLNLEEQYQGYNIVIHAIVTPTFEPFDWAGGFKAYYRICRAGIVEAAGVVVGAFTDCEDVASSAIRACRRWVDARGRP